MNAPQFKTQATESKIVSFGRQSHVVGGNTYYKFNGYSSEYPEEAGLILIQLAGQGYDISPALKNAITNPSWVKVARQYIISGFEIKPEYLRSIELFRACFKALKRGVDTQEFLTLASTQKFSPFKTMDDLVDSIYYLGSELAAKITYQEALRHLGDIQYSSEPLKEIQKAFDKKEEVYKASFEATCEGLEAIGEEAHKALLASEFFRESLKNSLN